MKILYYTSGLDGIGRVVQGMSIWNALRRRGASFEFLILSSTPAERAPIMDRLGVPHMEIPMVRDPAAVSGDNYQESSLFLAVAEFNPDILIADRVWFTLARFIDFLPCTKMFICSQVDVRFFSVQAGEELLAFRPEQYHRVIAIEPWNAPFEMERINPLIIRNRDEILPRARALEALGVTGGKPVCFIGLNFRDGYFEKLQGRYDYMEKAGEYEVICSTNLKGGGIFPLADYYNAIDMVVSSASYNIYWECRYFGIQGVFEPMPATFCDQARRVRECAGFTFEENGSDQLAEIIMNM